MINEIKEKGIIKSINNGVLTITKINTHTCTGCGMKGLCNLHAKPEIIVSSNETFNTGDIVDIYITPSSRLFSSFTIFILPLLILITTYFIIYTGLKQSELVSVGISLLSLVISFWLIKMIDKKYKTTHNVTIKRTELYENSP